VARLLARRPPNRVPSADRREREADTANRRCSERRDESVPESFDIVQARKESCGPVPRPRDPLQPRGMLHRSMTFGTAIVETATERLQESGDGVLSSSSGLC